MSIDGDALGHDTHYGTGKKLASSITVRLVIETHD